MAGWIAIFSKREKNFSEIPQPVVSRRAPTPNVSEAYQIFESLKMVQLEEVELMYAYNAEKYVEQKF